MLFGNVFYDAGYRVVYKKKKTTLIFTFSWILWKIPEGLWNHGETNRKVFCPTGDSVKKGEGYIFKNALKITI